MSHKQDLNKDHKCIATKCPGTKLDPEEEYGYWAYWWGNGPPGWHSKPNPNPTHGAGMHLTLKERNSIP